MGLFSRSRPPRPPEKNGARLDSLSGSTASSTSSGIPPHMPTPPPPPTELFGGRFQKREKSNVAFDLGGESAEDTSQSIGSRRRTLSAKHRNGSLIHRLTRKDSRDTSPIEPKKRQQSFWSLGWSAESPLPSGLGLPPPKQSQVTVVPPPSHHLCLISLLPLHSASALFI